MAGAGDIQGVYHRVEVKLQLKKLKEEDGCRRHVHGLRMMQIHTVGWEFVKFSVGFL